jgi:hypothetical protein
LKFIRLNHIILYNPEVEMGLLRPLNKAGFTDVLDYGIYLYKKHFKSIFLLSLMFNIPFVLILTVVNPIFTNEYQDLINIKPDMYIEPNLFFSSVLSLYSMLFVFLAIQSLYGLTLKNVLDGSIVKILYSDTVLEQERSIKQVVKECFRQFGSLFLGKLLYAVLQSVVFFVLYFVIFVCIVVFTFAIIGISAVSTATPWLAIVLSVIGISAAVAIIFFLGVTVCGFFGKYWMFLPEICIEQKKVGASMERCNKLGRKNFYVIGFTYMLSYIIVSLFPGVIGSVIGSVNVLSGNMDIGLLKAGTIITQLFSSILQPLIVCVLTALYITLRVKREGLDMEIDLYELKREETLKTRRWTREVPDA